MNRSRLLLLSGRPLMRNMKKWWLLRLKGYNNIPTTNSTRDQSRVYFLQRLVYIFNTKKGLTAPARRWTGDGRQCASGFGRGTAGWSCAPRVSALSSGWLGWVWLVPERAAGRAPLGSSAQPFPGRDWEKMLKTDSDNRIGKRLRKWHLQWELFPKTLTFHYRTHPILEKWKTLFL